VSENGVADGKLVVRGRKGLICYNLTDTKAARPLASK
jgi:hypothetical protein